MPRIALSVVCPECNKQYQTRCGLKKHLLKEHQLVFEENSDKTRSPTATELQNAILKRWKGQQHPERNVIPVLAAPSQSVPRKRTASAALSVPPASYRVAADPPAPVRNVSPPMPTLDTVNNLSSAQFERHCYLIM